MTHFLLKYNLPPKRDQYYPRLDNVYVRGTIPVKDEVMMIQMPAKGILVWDPNTGGYTTNMKIADFRFVVIRVERKYHYTMTAPVGDVVLTETSPQNVPNVTVYVEAAQ